MSKVSIAVTTQQLDTRHAETVIRALHNMSFFQLPVKAGPAATGVKLAVRIEQRLTATGAVVNTPLPALVVLTTEWRLGSGLPRDTELFRC